MQSTWPCCGKISLAGLRPRCSRTRLFGVASWQRLSWPDKLVMTPFLPLRSTKQRGIALPISVSKNWLKRERKTLGIDIDPHRNWCPHTPTPKQQAFLDLDCHEALYGGAAGGGKTDCLLMDALAGVNVPGYAALVLRRNYTMMEQPGGLIPRSHDWLGGTEAVWNGLKAQWTFPSGAVLKFGHVNQEKSKHNYQGGEYSAIFFDELTQFSEAMYRYIAFSRVRQAADQTVKRKVRATSNPGGEGHEWVKQRFIVESESHGRGFVPATVRDNPHIKIEEYIASLMHLDPLTRAQLLEGDWDAAVSGDFLKREWFETIDIPSSYATWMRYWDLAATPKTQHNDPDWTAGALVGVFRGLWYIRDMKRMRGRPDEVEKLVRQTAERDGQGVAISMEQEPGSSGVAVIQRYARDVLVGYAFRGIRSTGKKVERARILASAAEQGHVKLIRGPWIGDYLDEAGAFPHGSHDDQIDAVSGAMISLAGSEQSDRVFTSGLRIASQGMPGSIRRQGDGHY